jgi:hypothetical protein
VYVGPTGKHLLPNQITATPAAISTAATTRTLTSSMTPMSASAPGHRSGTARASTRAGNPLPSAPAAAAQSFSRLNSARARALPLTAENSVGRTGLSGRAKQIRNVSPSSS